MISKVEFRIVFAEVFRGAVIPFVDPTDSEVEELYDSVSRKYLTSTGNYSIVLKREFTLEEKVLNMLRFGLIPEKSFITWLLKEFPNISVRKNSIADDDAMSYGRDIWIEDIKIELKSRKSANTLSFYDVQKQFCFKEPTAYDYLISWSNVPGGMKIGLIADNELFLPENRQRWLCEDNRPAKWTKPEKPADPKVGTVGALHIYTNTNTDLVTWI